MLDVCSGVTENDIHAGADPGFLISGDADLEMFFGVTKQGGKKYSTHTHPPTWGF